MNLSPLGTSFKWNHTAFVLLWLVPFTERDVLWFPPCSICVRIPFLIMAESYSIVYIYYILFIHLSVDGHLSYFHLLPIVNNSAMNVGVQIFILCLLSILWDVYPKVELLDHVVILFNFLGTAILFSTVAALSYTLISNAERFHFLCKEKWVSKHWIKTIRTLMFESDVRGIVVWEVPLSIPLKFQQFEHL